MARLLTGIPEIDAGYGGATSSTIFPGSSDIDDADRNLKPNVSALERMLKSQQRTNKRIEDDPPGTITTGKSTTFVAKRLRALEQINRLAVKYDIPLLAFPLASAAKAEERGGEALLAALGSKGGAATPKWTWTELEKLRDKDSTDLEGMDTRPLVLPDPAIPVPDALTAIAAAGQVSGAKRKRPAEDGQGGTAAFARALLGLPTADASRAAAARKVEIAKKAESPVSTKEESPSQRDRFKAALTSGSSTSGSKLKAALSAPGAVSAAALGRKVHIIK